MFSRAALRAALLGIALVLVCLPRFDRRDVIPRLRFGAEPASVNLADAAKYIAYVELFRGQEVGDRLRPPFSYRPLAPFLASRLPFEPMTALNVLNVVALLVALCFLERGLARLGFGRSQRTIGAALFVFSFPTFYYGAIGYVDPVGLMFVAAGAYLTVAGNWVVLAAVLVLGTAAKETVGILLLAAGTAITLSSRPRRQKAMVLASLCMCYGAAAALIRWYAPGDAGYAWKPSAEVLLSNLSRPSLWAASVLSFGLPGVLAVWSLVRLSRACDRRALARLAPLLAGLVGAFGVFAYSCISGYADGRFLWLGYPFAIPIGTWVWRERGAVKSTCASVEAV